MKLTLPLLRFTRFFFSPFGRVGLGFLLVFSLPFLEGSGGASFAQDIHFSQSNMTPLLLNPALTGMYDGNQRVFLNYKNQWKGMGMPGATYNTGMFSFDTHVLKKKWHNGYLGAGLNAFKDVAGELKMGTTQLNISISGIVFINKQQLISGGLQGGYVQKSISTASLQWENQYDAGTGAYNSSLPSNDFVSIPPYSYGDFSAGLAWSYNAYKPSTYGNKQMKFNLGIGAFHLNRPNQKLNPFSTDVTDNLNSKFIFHGAAQIAIASSKYQLIPTFALFKQGPSYDLNLGTMVRWTIKGESRYTGYVQGMALSLGALYRAKDAIIPMMLFEYSDFAVGLSYDINTSSLIQGTRGRGGVEISLRYVRPLGISPTRLID